MQAKHLSERSFVSVSARAFSLTLALTGLIFSRPVPAVEAVARHDVGDGERLSETLRLSRQLQDATTWQARRAAFDALVQLGVGYKPSRTAPRDGVRRLASHDDPRAREALSQALIAAAAAENRSLSRSSNSEEAELRVDLLWALATLHDPRSIDVLLDAVNIGNVAVAPLAGFGDKSLAKVIDRLSAKPDRETKLSLMLVVYQMCKPINSMHLSAESKATVRRTLLSALNDPDPLIRQTGCKGLALLADPSTIADLERVASKDPETSDKSGHLSYPIRDQAKDAIETIRANQPPPKPKGQASLGAR